MDDDDETETFSTQEEAIAAALAESEPGDAILIHEATCTEPVLDGPCPCGGLMITVGGAEA